MHPHDRPINPEPAPRDLTNDDFETIHKMYLNFVETTQKGVTGRYQIRETRRAFYAGAIAVWAGVMGFSKLSDEEWQAEFEAFFKSVTKDRD